MRPITGGPGVPYAGYSYNEIDVLKGEMVLNLSGVTVGADGTATLTLFLNVQVNSGAQGVSLLGARGSLDARDPFALGVRQGGVPVFVLPAGYTVNSTSLGIVDNRVGSDTAKCPQPQSYWRINPEVWPSSTLTLGAQTYSAAELMTILQTPVGSGPKANASLILADQLIAAKLNVANGSDPAPVAAAISTADGLLSGFSGKLPYKVKPSSAVGKKLTAAASALESYNLLQLTPNCRP